MEKLKHEELALIMRLVTDPSARKSASHVCKGWWVAERLTRSSLRLFNLDYLPRLLARYPNLTTFETNKVIRISDDYLELVSQSCPNLEAIKLDAVPPSPSAFNRDREELWEMLLSGRGESGDQLRELQQVGDKGLCALVNGCLKLSKVVIKNSEVGMVGIMAMITSAALTHLVLERCSLVPDRVLEPSTCLIRVLSLRGCSDNGLSYLTKRRLGREVVGMFGFMAMITSTAHSLTHLDLGGCSWVSDKVLEAIGSSSCPIRVFCLESYSITDDGLRFLVNGSCSETIEVLSLAGCSRITDDGVLLLCKMRVLEKLSLTKCGKLTDVGGQAISTIPTLKKLNLTSRFFFSSRSLLTEKTFVALAKNCINLEVLCLDSVTAVNTGAIVAFMGHECLRSLKLNGSLHDDFRVSSLDCLALLCPSLESIVVHECWRERLLRELHETTVSRFLQFVKCRCRSNY